MRKRHSAFARNALKDLNATPGLPKLPPHLQDKLLDELDGPVMQANQRALRKAKALYAEIIAREKITGGPIPMLQDFMCRDCGYGGVITVGSRDKLSSTFESLSLLHSAERSACHERIGGRAIAVSAPRLADFP